MLRTQILQHLVDISQDMFHVNNTSEQVELLVDTSPKILGLVNFP